MKRIVALALLFLTASAFGQTKDAIVPAPADSLGGTNQQKCAQAYGGLTCVYADAGVIKIVTTVDGVKWRGPDTIGPGTEPSFAMANGVGGVAYTLGKQTLYRFYRNGAWTAPTELSGQGFPGGPVSMVASGSKMYVAVKSHGIWFAEFPADNPDPKREYVRVYPLSAAQAWSHVAIVAVSQSNAEPLVRIAYFWSIIPDNSFSPSISVAVADRPPTKKTEWPQQSVETVTQQNPKSGAAFSLSAAAEQRTGDFYIIASYTAPTVTPQKRTKFYRQNLRTPAPWQITTMLANKLAQVSVAAQTFDCETRVRIVVAEEGIGPVWVRTGVPNAAIEWYDPQTMGSGGSIGHATFYSTRVSDFTPKSPRSLDVDAFYLDSGKLHSWRHTWRGQMVGYCSEILKNYRPNV
jgi:hypothetical protein